MRYEDVVALGDFSSCGRALSKKTYQMIVETRLRTRGHHDKKERFRCCMNSGMGEYAFGAQELKGRSAFNEWKVASW